MTDVSLEARIEALEREKESLQAEIAHLKKANTVMTPTSEELEELRTQTEAQAQKIAELKKRNRYLLAELDRKTELLEKPRGLFNRRTS